MGCCSSTNANASINLDTISNGYYAATSQQRQGSKRSYSSRISSGSSSGVSSACTSPSRRSILSRTTNANNAAASNTASPNGLKAKTSNFTLTRKDIPSKAFEMLSICDDFGEAVPVQNDNGSYGYYSESMGSAGSSPSQTCLRRTQDTSSLRPESPEPQVTVTPTPSDLEMEMYMMSHSQGLMPKTSSPIFHRRDVTFNAVAVASPPSQSYKKWANYLQTTPAYMLHNVTDIPEAIAGHFSPLDFPGFTDLEDMESAAKRFKVDIHMQPAYESEEDEVFYQKQIPRPSNVTHTITTDL